MEKFFSIFTRDDFSKAVKTSENEQPLPAMRVTPRPAAGGVQVRRQYGVVKAGRRLAADGRRGGGGGATIARYQAYTLLGAAAAAAAAEGGAAVLFQVLLWNELVKESFFGTS